MNRADIWDAILFERARQSAKWSGVHDWGTGDCSSRDVADLVKQAVLTEEAGEVTRAVLDRSPQEHLVEELVQVAAVAVAWLESM